MKKNDSIKYIICGVLVIILGVCFMKNVKAESVSNTSKNIISNSVMTAATIDNIFEVWNGEIDCGQQFSKTRDLLNKVFGYVRIGAALLFIVLSSTEYIKAMASSDASAFKKTNTKTIKRLVALIIVLILPSLIKLIMAIIQLKSGTCGVGF